MDTPSFGSWIPVCPGERHSPHYAPEQGQEVVGIASSPTVGCQYPALPDGQRVLTSLFPVTTSDLADYQPLLAHLAEPSAPAQPTAPGE